MRLIYRPDAGDGSTGGDAGQNQNQDGEQKPQAQQPDEKRFSQTDVDAIAAKVRTEERRKAKAEAEEEARKAQMSEAERLKAEKAEAEAKAEAARAAADARALKADLKVAAAAAGVKAERLDYVLRLVDITSIPVTDGEPDQKAIKDAIGRILTDFPELKGEQAQARGGSNFGGSGGDSVDLGSLSMSEYIAQRRKMSEG